MKFCLEDDVDDQLYEKICMTEERTIFMNNYSTQKIVFAGKITRVFCVSIVMIIALRFIG